MGRRRIAANHQIEVSHDRGRVMKVAQPVAEIGDRCPFGQRGQQQRELRKEVAALERNITRLDGRRRQLNAELLEATDPNAALRLHDEITAIVKELAPIEHRWCELQELVEADEC